MRLTDSKERPQIPEDLADIVAATAQHGKYATDTQPLDGASRQAAVALHLSDLGLYATAPSEQLFELGRQSASDT